MINNKILCTHTIYVCSCTRTFSTKNQSNSPNVPPNVPSKSHVPISYYRNTFITPLRAINDYLIDIKHLENLNSRLVRNAYTEEPTFDKCYLKSDVEKKAETVWGSMRNLELEHIRRKRLMEDSEFRTKVLGALIGRLKKRTKYGFSHQRKAFTGGSGRVVGLAIVSNATVMVLKFGAYLSTGSASMLSESVHSLADTLNQILLAIGVAKSSQDPSPDHPYGFATARYIYSLMSGMSVFFIGAGFSCFHGWTAFSHPPEYTSNMLPIAMSVLFCSFIVEGLTLLAAIKYIRYTAKQNNVSFREYVIRGRDPSAVAVLLEDSVAVLGVATAAIFIGFTVMTGNHVYDAIGSIAIGFMLGCVGTFLVKRNSEALMGRSISHERLRHIIDLLERDRIILSLHDVKALDLGADVIRFKAEVNFDGKELARVYIDRQNVKSLLAEVQTYKTEQEFYDFLLYHGEQIVDTLGTEVDRIEKNIKKAFPEAKHVDLEVL